MSAEVKPGYKQTEVGVVPEDWKIARIGETLKIRHGKSQHEVARENGDYPILATGGEIGRASRPIYSKPSVLIGRKGTIDVPRFTDTPFWSVDTLFYSEVFESAVPKFLFYKFCMIDWYSYNEASGVPSLNAKTIERIPVTLPPTKLEQQRIAEALSDADALIEGLGQLISKKRQLKQGAMQELLHPKDEWETVKLGVLGTFTKGSGVRKDESLSGHLPCVRYGEIYTKHNDYIKTYYSRISPEVAATARRLEAGDILFAGSGETKEEIGKSVAFIDNIEAYAGGDIVILRPKKGNSTFLGYYLNTPSINSQKASKGQGDAVVHISSNALTDIDIVLPSEQEQTEIATVLSDMDAEIAGLEAKLDKARRIKEGMMQELLTGKVRLV